VAAAAAPPAVAHRCTYGVSASATGSFMGIQALLHMMASTMCEPGPSSSFCNIDGSPSGSSAAAAAAAEEDKFEGVFLWLQWAVASIIVRTRALVQHAVHSSVGQTAVRLLVPTGLGLAAVQERIDCTLCIHRC
jgi:hypothetical protein